MEFNLFEFQNEENYPDFDKDLDVLLEEIWKTRKYPNSIEEEGVPNSIQRFLKINHRSQSIKANNYVGIIYHNGNKIQILPKIFYEDSNIVSTERQLQIQNHILWYLSYSTKIQFPKYQYSQIKRKSDFLEVLIYMFSDYTKKILSNSIFRRYEIEEENLSFVKGKINIKESIYQNFSKGKWHLLNCTFDDFTTNNKFYQIVKFVSRQLLLISNNNENKKILREILFILDEVDDVPITILDCRSIVFPLYFQDHEIILNYCELFLSNSVMYNYKNQIKLFALLVPMESIYEEFISGFIKKEFSNWDLKVQKQEYLDTTKIFTIKPDLEVFNENGNYLADAKYKLLSFNNDKMDSISQSDLYQMVSYAIRKKIQKVKLLYPENLKTSELLKLKIEVEDLIAEGKIIEIDIHQIPMIQRDRLDKELSDLTIEDEFQELREKLKNSFIGIFNKVANV
jgi:5-methylcytosine-specific restriction enzyme subunit McrC